ncbi:MAG: kynureninase [Amaricoccus sp.]
MTDDAFWAAALAEAEAADAADPLAGFRHRFRLPPGVIYLDGNSLGPAPEAALSELRHAAETEWAQGLIGSWNSAGWWMMPERYGDLIAPLIGADAGEVVVTDTTSLNLCKALHAGLSLRPDRHVVVAEGDCFPTDVYVAQGLALGRPEVRLRLEGIDGPELEGLIAHDVAVVLVNQVDYRTGRRRDVAELTGRIHAAGAVAVWDLCHSAGVMEVGLNAAGADLAVGCTYKYLNGGPGSPGFVFCASRHQATVRQPLTGWWGHARPFAFEGRFEPDPGIRRFLCGTQPILSFRGMKAGLELAAEAGIAAVRAKSVALTARFAGLAEAATTRFGVGMFGPRDPEARGSQVALTHPEGYAVMQALIARGVVGDFRMPDILRFGFAPLYVRHVDVVRAARTLEQVLAGRAWDDPRYKARSSVT